MGRSNRRRGRIHANWKGGSNNNKQQQDDTNQHQSEDRNKQRQPTRNRNDGETFVASITNTGNFKMECYYAIQGLHDSRWIVDDNNNKDGSSMKLVPCTTDDEKNNERLRWRDCIAQVLPSSFRFAKDIPQQLLESLENQLHALLEDCCTGNTGESTNNNEIIMEEDVIKKEDNTDTDKNEVDTTTTNTTTTSNYKRKGKEYTLLPKKVSEIIKKLQFLPHSYQLECDKTTIRKNPKLAAVHAWLIQQTDTGYITRQETVSMIPPVLLNCQPTDYVLDMCAAPGSKTSQILEVLTDGGCLVANDNNPSRAYMLVHQLKRVNSNNPVVVITACDAQFFPSTFGKSNNSASIKQFNRILCDVPCSGDGTSRKNIGVWRSWTSVAAYSLHTLQYNIAWKGISQLLQVGGYMCYSTCSLNPIENEAVVAHLLRQGNGSIELVDCRTTFAPADGFKTRPGISNWKVLIESKSRKEMKNQRNKNKATERYKKKQDDEGDDEKQPTDETGTIIKKEENSTDGNEITNENDNGVDIAAADNNNENNNNDDVAGDEEVVIDEYKLDQEQMFGQKFNPTAWDEATLLDMVQNNCGLRYFKSYDEVIASEQPHIQERIKESCFPPSPDEVSKFNLQYCIRCLPQDNNTGGFFVALLKKVAPISTTDRKATAQQQQQQKQPETIDDSTTDPEPTIKRPRIDGNDEEENKDKAVVKDESMIPEEDGGKDDNQDAMEDDNDDNKFMQSKVVVSRNRLRGRRQDSKATAVIKNGDEDNIKGNLMEGSTTIGNDDCVPVPDEIFDPLIDYYGLDLTTFPREQYMQRACATETKVIYYVAKPIKSLIDHGMQQRITIIHTGLRGFARNNRNNAGSEVMYRVCQEGIQFLLPHMKKRIFYVNEKDFRTSVATPGKTAHLSNFSTELAEQLKPLSAGSFVLVLDWNQVEINTLSDKVKAGDDKVVLAAVMWKCRGESIDSLVAKFEIDGMLAMLDAMKGL